MIIDCFDEIQLIEIWRIYGRDGLDENEMTSGAKELRKTLRALIQKEDENDHRLY